jgi:DNA mismatch repair ATPase MutS
MLVPLDAIGYYFLAQKRTVTEHKLEQHIHHLASMERWVSLAGFAFLFEDYRYASFEEDSPYFFKGVAIGHPLIPPTQSVKNSFEIGGEGAIGLITGSNMSGKSTFLRTVGLQALMSRWGLPVPAEACSLGGFEVFTSMRSQDNLQESVSAFYAELSRIRQLLELLKEGRPVFFLLDEILKGTNSQDRYKGSEALLKQLHEDNGIGLLSTHDLGLSVLEEETNILKNYHFDNEVRGDELIFDYKLKEGPCKTFNASLLMSKIGIQIQE